MNDLKAIWDSLMKPFAQSAEIPFPPKFYNDPRGSKKQA